MIIVIIFINDAFFYHSHCKQVYDRGRWGWWKREGGLRGRTTEGVVIVFFGGGEGGGGGEKWGGREEGRGGRGEGG